MDYSHGETMMGLLDSVMGALGGAGGNGGNNAMLDVVMQMLSNKGQSGGLAALVQAFQQNGLGEQMNSWISTGQNLPVSPDQIRAALGSGQLGQIAGQLGMNESQAAGGLADLLPQVIDKLTPNGQLPQGDDLMVQGLELLKGKLFG
ncbi:MAG TPA: YidB family protein [Thiobacillus sp.]|nr:YidB family protein [Thiobacillus sp.]HQT01258.1 YidB family protein [Thiobacillus sp.]